MVADPRDYRWSSHRALAFGESDSLLTPHPEYLALSTDTAKRQQHYRAMVMTAVDAEEVDAIRCHLQSQHPYAQDRFRLAIEAQLGRTVGPQKIGRPRKQQQKQNRGQSRLLIPGELSPDGI